MNAGRKWLGLLALAGLLWGGGAVRAQEQEYEFGVVPYLKNYPEFKRGPDPWANLSGTVQENVDLYGGKLNLSLALPGLPWSETAGFAPVLRYSSNVWSYRQPLNLSLTVGGERSEPGEPFEPDTPDYKFPDYWGNDAWTRFSPIGRPHAMPGWTLAVGGVYTEVTFGTGAIGSTAELCFRPLVEQRYFVSPDGAAHLLVDLETDNRPFFTWLGGALDVTDPSPEWLDAYSCHSTCEPEGTDYCLPLRRSGADRAWRAVDGSGYYYVENQHKVYGPDGTTYELAPDGEDKGRIVRMTDLAGNAIAIGRTDGGGFRTFRYTGPTGAAVEVVFEQRTLPNYIPDGTDPGTDPDEDPIEIWLLHHVTAPAAGGGTLQWSFTAENLVEHLQAGYPGTPDTVTWGHLFDNCILHCGGDDDLDPHDTSATIFISKIAPGPEHMVRNAQAFVLTAMTLPDGRQFRFDYNRAGKIRQVSYPDGGRRVYEYGNTVEPSILYGPSCAPYPAGWPGLNAGESPHGAVSLVWQDLDTQPGGETLERAYAYSGYLTGPDGVTTLSWRRQIRADGTACGAVQLHQHYPSEQMDTGQEILQFGQPAWQTGKLRKVSAYNLTDRTEATDAEFRNYFLQLDETGGYLYHDFPQVRGRFLTDLTNAPLPLLRETGTVHENWEDGWVWDPPGEKCTPPPPAECSSECCPIAGYYAGVIPPTGLALPEWNPVVMEEWTREYAPDGSCLTSKVKYVWGDAETPGGTEGNACLLEKWEYGWGAGETAGALVRKQTYEYWHYWPAVPDPDLPARRLALPKLSQTFDGSEQLQAAERTAYSWGDNDPPVIGGRLDFRPTSRETWRGGADWIQTDFSYGYLDPGAEAMVRQTALTVKDADVVKNTVRYFYTPPEAGGLLRQGAAAPGMALEPELYLLLDYDPGTGLLLRRADGNGDADGDGAIDPGADDYIEFAYDGFNRLEEVRLRHGAESLLLSEYAYTAAGAPFAVTRTDWLDETHSSRSRVENDALGRPAHRWASLNEATESYVLTEHDPLGRTWKEHLPEDVPAGSRAGLRAAYQEHVYDALDREVETKKPAPAGRAQVSSRVEYGVDLAEARTTAKAFDEEDRWRRLGYDGLGRLQRVDEPDPAAGPDLQTSYAYDALDRLTEVAQGGQEREFAYDAAGRLLSATLPEYGNGTMSYEYDDLGNVTYKHLGAYTEELFYDWLGRLTGRSVSLVGQVTIYEYEYDTAHLAGPDGFDSGAYTRGRLVRDRVIHPEEAGQAGRVSVERFFAYDWRGNLVRQTERFARDAQAEAFTTTFEYDRQGNPVTITYPSGQEETLAYERGRLAQIGWNGQTLFDGLVYAPHGAAEEAHGHGPDGGEVTWAQKFNERNWPAQLFLNAGDTSPDPGSVTLVQLHYFGYEDNGNITDLSRAIRPTAGAAATAFKSWFAYDELNRLAHFEFEDGLPVESGAPAPGFEGRYLNPYDYIIDRFGNVTARDYTGSEPDVPGDLVLPVNPITNQLTGYTYDCLGNQIRIEQDGTTLNLTYLDQGHVWEIYDAMNSLQYRYYYDADGKRRIKAKASGGLTNFQEDASYYFYEGESLACQLDIGVLAPEEEEFYEPKFLMLDHLGSTRAEITFEGAGLTPTVSGRYDYMPYGQFINVPAEAAERVCFTGKPRDPESGLDNFGPRGLNSNLCRWISPDRLFADNQPENPQSWNLYHYCSDNPVNKLDPLGLFEFDPNATEDEKIEFQSSLTEANAARDFFDPSSPEYQKLDEAIQVYGEEGESNNIWVSFTADPSAPPGQMIPITPKDASFAGATAIFRSDSISPVHTAHEGTHISTLKKAFEGNLGYEYDQNLGEISAYHTSSLVIRGMGLPYMNQVDSQGNQYQVWNQENGMNYGELRRLMLEAYRRSSHTVPSVEEIESAFEAGLFW